MTCLNFSGTLDRCFFKAAAHNRRRRIVKLVREARRKFAQRNHFLVLLLELGEVAHPVQHPVHQRFGQFVLGVDHLRKPVAVQHQDGGGFGGQRIVAMAMRE